MRTPPTPHLSTRHTALTQGTGGFALPTVLVIVSALLILAMGMLLLVGTERNTARSYVDYQRADLAVRAGLEEFKGILTHQTANDTFTILQATPTEPSQPGRTSAPFLFLAQGKKSGGSDFTFQYTPLFSATAPPPDTGGLSAPEVAPLVSSDPAAHVVLEALPYLDPVRAAWVPVLNGKQEMVGRYAYWVEDLQGKIDPQAAGNSSGSGGASADAPFPFPAAGMNHSLVALGPERIALHAVDPATTAEKPSDLGKTLVARRPLLLTPDSVLAAAALQPPLTRDGFGHVIEPTARAVEENLATTQQPYLEQPRVPFAAGIDASVAGEPKLNLNALVASGPAGVDRMAAFINKALPEFESRMGGFPDDYLKSLAANAIDYADSDTQSNLVPGSHRGLDGFPLLSELSLQVNYLGLATTPDKRTVLKWRMRLFAELWNMTSQTVSGKCRLSYEVALPMEGIGAGTSGKRFDDPTLLNDDTKSDHQLVKIDGRFWTPEKTLTLGANEYQVHEFATVTYTIDVGPSSVFIVGPVSLTEQLGAAGCSLRWNDQEVDRIPTLVRQKTGLVFQITQPATESKATVAALSYGPYTQVPTGYRNNLGDSRSSYYLRSLDYPCGENASPENTSPNRRNIRRDSIYDNDSSRKPKVYGRVLPSEWPDGGHDSPVGSWTLVKDNAMIPSDPIYAWSQNPLETQAPQRLSNCGQFYSATELGRLYDPLMWWPTFDSSADTDSIRTGLMPTSRFAWPDVMPSSPPSVEHGGGNTLRIGRPEHLAFDRPGKRASQLLDLFHAGQPRSDEEALREGELVEIRGQVNLNTAPRDALRALAAGVLQQDPLLATTTSTGSHQGAPLMAPPTTKTTLYAPSSATKTEADRIADALLRSRPFVSPAEAALARGADGKPVFGNPEVYQTGGQLPTNTRLQWTDAAAEEVFARVYEAATVRSRNFRVWVVGQAINPVAVTAGTPAPAPEVLAEVRKVFTLFADPGKRASDGTIDPLKFHPTVIHERDF